MIFNANLAYGIFSLLSGIVSIGLAVYLAPFWRRFGARQLMLLTAASAVWSMTYAMELLSPDFMVKLFWVRLEYTGSAWIGMLVFTFILSITGRTRNLTRPAMLLLCMVPAAILVLVFTNEMHGFMWKDAWTENISGMVALFYHRGPGFWFFLVFSYALLFCATLILMHAIFVTVRDHFRRQLKIILLGIMVPWVCNIVYIFKFPLLQGIDLTPFAFMVTGLIFVWALTRYQLLHLIPLAREAVMDSMGDPVVVLDMADRVVEVNQACTKLFAIKNFVPGMRDAGEMFPDLFSLVEQHRAHVPVAFETAFAVNGILYHWHLSLSALTGARQDQKGWLVVFRDITEQKKTQEMMVHSEKMISVGGLAAGMAHEINNPLAGMLQIIQVIQNRLSRPLPANLETARKHGLDLDKIGAYMTDRQIFDLMDQAIAVGKRAAAIVQNMLSFSRKSDSRRSSHLLAEMMDATLDLLKNDFNLKKQHDILAVKIDTRMDAKLPPVPCEKTKIQQVFFNILKNGVEAMSEAQTPQPRFDIRYFLENNMAGVEIRDNGPGIPEKVRKRIFEPFFTTKEVGIGTGLGLSVSYFIITENHGGDLSVSSTPGKGTTFFVKLPLS